VRNAYIGLGLLLFGCNTSKGHGDGDGDGINIFDTDLTDTADSGTPTSDNRLEVEFTMLYDTEPVVEVSPGQEDVIFGSFTFASRDLTLVSINTFAPVFYIADDTGSPSGYHAGHHGNLYANAYIGACRLAPMDDGEAPVRTGAPGSDGTTVFDDEPFTTEGEDFTYYSVICDMLNVAPDDDSVAFTIDARDATTIAAEDEDGLSVPAVIGATNGDPPERVIILTP
jgi:hypothetical protein